jgi:hypothetical protein
MHMRTPLGRRRSVGNFKLVDDPVRTRLSMQNLRFRNWHTADGEAVSAVDLYGVPVPYKYLYSPLNTQVCVTLPVVVCLMPQL